MLKWACYDFEQECAHVEEDVGRRRTSVNVALCFFALAYAPFLPSASLAVT